VTGLTPVGGVLSLRAPGGPKPLHVAPGRGSERSIDRIVPVAGGRWPASGHRGRSAGVWAVGDSKEGDDGPVEADDVCVIEFAYALAEFGPSHGADLVDH
jgi:hypothetical protein